MIYSPSIFDGILYSPVFTDGPTRPLNVEVPTIYAVSPCRNEVVDCHNLASARAYASGRLPTKSNAPKQTTVSVSAFVSPSGQYYVQHGNQRMDVANASTARYYVKNGVPASVLLAASLSDLALSLNQ